MSIMAIKRTLAVQVQRAFELFEFILREDASKRWREITIRGCDDDDWLDEKGNAPRVHAPNLCEGRGRAAALLPAVLHPQKSEDHAAAVRASPPEPQQVHPVPPVPEGLNGSQL